MALLVAEIATSFLIFVCVVQGIRSLQIEYKQSLNATVRQNVSLPCIVLDEEVQIIQLEWHKVGKTGDEKLVVFNPVFSPSYYWDVKLQLVNKPNSNKLQGTILLLNEVTEEDNGDYVCEISTFPAGSFRKTSKVTVTVPWITATVESPGTSVVEGDEVKITCASHPPADRYRLHLQTTLSLESQTGHFTVQNVTRHCTELTCRPLWTSSNQHLRSLNASVQLTVDYLDPIECDANSSIEVETGTNLSITCTAKSSRRLYYTWTKEKVTVSSHATMSLWSVNPYHSGVYYLTISAERLRRQREFMVTVVNRTHVGTTTIPKETTPQVTEGTTLVTAKGGLSTVTSRPVYIYNTTSPSAGNITTSRANITAAHPPENISTPSSLNASAEGTTGCCRNGTSRPGSTGEGSTPVHPNSTIFLKPRTTLPRPGTTISRPGATMFKPRTTFSEPGTTMFKPNWTKKNVATVKTVQDTSSSTSHAAYILIPVVLLLVLIGFLYRRYLIQKRMDMPPPFKPPPPPVKYTSVRSQDIPVTDILV